MVSRTGWTATALTVVGAFSALPSAFYTHIVSATGTPWATALLFSGHGLASIGGMTVAARAARRRSLVAIVVVGVVLDAAASRQAMVSRLGSAFGDDPVAAAAGVARVVDEHMALAVQVHATEHGHDPRTFPMVAFGGAAPVHAARIARILGVSHVVIPAAAGVLSATGLLVAPPMVEESRTRLLELRDWDAAAVEAIYADLVAQAQRELGTDVARIDRFVEMRFLGQGFEIEVAVGDGDDPAGYRDRFVREYEHIYGVTPDYERIEIVTWRVRVYGPFTVPTLTRTVSPDASEERTRTRTAWFAETGLVEVPVRRMLSLPPEE
ncbi:hypothetical protein CJ026_025970, partial [Ralstonia pickettii]|uniref:hydantoinase/oxoprolinase family protein n=1 Tax=Ralstonia pickettii TaxID=329 RepID=UPI000D285080